MTLLAAALIHSNNDRSYWSDYLCAGAAGMQNAMGSKYSGCIIRTTHVSGATSDIGTNIARVFVKGHAEDRWKLRLLVPTLLMFIFGGFLGQLLHPYLDKYQLFVSVGFYGCLGPMLFYFDTLIKKYNAELETAQAAQSSELHNNADNNKL
jgi:uncharacterized membrane protein YoaK (UPF0700 family)